MSVSLQNLVAVQRPEPDEYLGYLIWYTVCQCQIDRDTLRNLLAEAGLGEEWMPRPIRVPDAFRRAMKAIEQKKVPGPDNNVYYNFLVREVGSDEQTVQHNIVREAVYPTNRELDYVSDVAVLTLRKDSATVEVQTSGDLFVRRLCDEAVELFEQLKTHHDSRAIRGMIYNMLAQMAGMPVRPSGGVYFVPRKYEDLLSKMVRFLQLLGNGSEGFMTPLVDQTASRDMVRQKLREYLRETVSELADGLRRNEARSKVSSLFAKARQVLGSFNEYRAVLESELEDMNELVDLIRQQMQSLLKKLETDDQN